MKPKGSAFFQFLEDPQTPVATLRTELEQSGASLARLEQRVNDIIARHKPAAASTDWLTQARELQKRFDARVKAKKTWLSDQFKGAKELAAAIQNGELGFGLQTQAQVYFRDQDLEKVSEQDLRSFARDREILAELEAEDLTQKKT